MEKEDRVLNQMTPPGKKEQEETDPEAQSLCERGLLGNHHQTEILGARF